MTLRHEWIHTGLATSPAALSLAQALGRLLKALDSAQPSGGGRRANILVLYHNHAQVPLDAQRLRFFRLSADGRRQRVLVFCPSSVWLGDRPGWVFIFDGGLAGTPRELRKWLRRSDGDDAQTTARPLPDADTCRGVLAHPPGYECKNPLDEKFSLLAPNLASRTDAQHCLWNSTEMFQFYYGLLLVTGAVGIRLHDEERYLDVGGVIACGQRDESDATSTGTIEVCLRKHLLSHAETLRKALCCLGPLRRQLHNAAERGDGRVTVRMAPAVHNALKMRIAVIDDRAEDVARELQKVLAPLGIIRDGDPESIMLVPLDGKAAEKWVATGIPAATRDALLSCTAIVVDQLFKGGTGRESFLGPRLIRLLRREIRNFGKPDLSPAVIALSRTQLPETIDAALRAGADDYVLKSQLLGLPCALARSRRSRETLDCARRENFRQLYLLPNEVQGLLRAICVPALRLSGRGPSAAKNAYLRSPVRSLLTRIPKADLHVHAGSCMSPEFMIEASLLGLAQFGGLTADVGHLLKDRAVQTHVLGQFLSQLERGQIVSEVLSQGALRIPSPRAAGIRQYVKHVKKHVTGALNAWKSGAAHVSGGFTALRAALHAATSTRIRDHLDADEAAIAFNALDDVHTLLFTLGHSTINGTRIALSDDDVIRVWLLALAGTVTVTVDRGRSFAVRVTDADSVEKSLVAVHEAFSDGALGLTGESFRARNWAPPRDGALSCSLACMGRSRIVKKQATGRHSRNLKEYLEGCEFSGSCHLKHPYLIHRYAQVVVSSFCERGLMYAELRASVDGYVNHDIGFDFKDACECIVTAFSCSQARAAAISPKDVFPKVSLIFVGKRHKPMRELMLEADAVGMMCSVIPNSFKASEFDKEMRQCRVVGFDLAGNEPDYPPSDFAEEFRRLSRHHIPITVHAGENAPANFVEDAIVVLGAARIGHGLAIIEDRGLLRRVREDGVCIELCPISNDQTGAFSSARPYPLHRFMQEGIDVCLNTDNPTISGTDIVKEFFQASWAIQEAKRDKHGEHTDIDEGLTLWDALLLIKTSFKRAFLPLPLRRELLAKADDLIYEMLLEPEVMEQLRDLVHE